MVSCDPPLSQRAPRNHTAAAMHQSTDVAYVDSLPALQQLAKRLAGAEWLAVDTEFVRERTYFPKFCLLQLATTHVAACVDTLALTDLSPLSRLFDDDRTVKIFHSGRQDLEVLYQRFGRLPNPIFDTQIAAAFLGFPDQVGYASLLLDVLQIRIAKSLRRTDWSLRPLSAEQLAYAAEDVIHLGPLYQTLVERIGKFGRQEWVAEETRLLQVRSLYEPDPEDAWRRIGGSSSLNDAQAAVLKRLASWRELTARDQDRPRNWVIRDDALLELAKQFPGTLEALRQIRGINEKIERRHGKALLDIIQHSDHPPLPDSRRPIRQESTEDETLANLLGEVVKLRSGHAEISPTLVASRRMLKEFVASPLNSPLLRGWRKAFIGDELYAVLADRHSNPESTNRGGTQDNAG